MPTFREDPKIGSKVPLIKTADLNDKSVTEKKLADGAVTKDKLSHEVLNGLPMERITEEEIEIIVGEKGDIK
ncbi:hypothetical protein [uncultured Prevotella sp.]|jgi:hypothetical protein|uniref:hypothetical protein n=1 Tax=uncultured Prevotella sp. TaxID=159272 RepID=UPI00204CE5A6|nr:hypothetical protein [uncultured Prevotella sp.]DAI38172.1 MAG TPA: hypothetical protein [Caudoviricetes sp.]